MKMFDTLGMVTLVTPPSMLLPEKISFTLINLKEKEKNYFAKELNRIFPQDNVTVYIYSGSGVKGWLKQAMNNSKYVMVNKTNLPIWVTEELPTKNCYEINDEQTVEESFKTVAKGMKNNV